MKTNAHLDAVIGSSREQIVEALLLDSVGAPVATLPVVGGEIVGSMLDRSLDRWDGNLVLPLQDVTRGDGGEPFSTWPDSPTHPLSGFAPYSVSVRAGAVVNEVEQTVEVARLAVMGTQRTTTADRTEITVNLAGLGRYLELGVERAYVPNIGETVQEFLVRVIETGLAPWMNPVNVIDSTTPQPMPDGYGMTDVISPVTLVQDLLALGNLVAFFDAHARLIIKYPDIRDGPLLPTPDRTFSIGDDITEYDAYVGRDNGFANTVTVDWDPFGIRRRARQTADWTYEKATSGWPSSGQMVALDEPEPSRVRIHYNDNSGKRRYRFLESIQTGDVVILRSNSGAESVFSVEDTNEVDDFSSYVLTVRTLDTIGGGVSNNDVIELESFAKVSKTRRYEADRTTGDLGSDTVGHVAYTESRNGGVDASLGQSYTDSLLDSTMAAWSILGPLRAVPDFRMEPNDNIEVATESGTTLCWVTEVVLPLAPGESMQLALRTYPDQQGVL